MLFARTSGTFGQPLDSSVRASDNETMAMTEQEWLECEDPRWLLEHLRKQARSRKLRLFACACVRRAWRRIPNPVCRQALEVAEQYADREVKNATRQQANRAAKALCRRGFSASVSLAYIISGGPRYTHVDAS